VTNGDRPPGTILLADGPVSSLDAYLEGGGWLPLAIALPMRSSRRSAAPCSDLAVIGQH
jgi:hypothetical protein